MLREDIFDSKLSYLLYPLSLLYKIAVKMRLFVYKKGIIKKVKLPGFVVSVGNITVGGTGKTPMVIEIAQWAKEQGYKVAVLSRGYKGDYKGWLLVSDGVDLITSPKQSGDEPYLIANRLKGVIVAVSKNRYALGFYIWKYYGVNFFILDDGFQYFYLNRDVDIVLVNADKPFGNKRLLPSGPLREPINHISRADICVITDGDHVPQELSAYNLSNLNAVYIAHYMAESLIFYHDSKMPIHILQNKRVVGFAGISRPIRFKNLLYRLGAKVVFFKGFPDHYWFKEEDINELIYQKNIRNADFILTTEKDWVRIMKKDLNIGYIKVKLLIKDKDRFFDFIDKAYEKYKKK